MDKHDKNFFAGLAAIVTSTVISMYIFSALGSQIFYLPAIIPSIVLGLLLSVISVVAMWVMMMTTFIIFNKVKQPGIVIPLIEGFIACTFGVWLAATLLPEAITAKTVWDAVSFSLVNTPLAAAMLLVVFPKLRELQIWPTT